MTFKEAFADAKKAYKAADNFIRNFEEIVPAFAKEAIAKAKAAAPKQ